MWYFDSLQDSQLGQFRLLQLLEKNDMQLRNLKPSGRLKILFPTKQGRMSPRHLQGLPRHISAHQQVFSRAYLLLLRAARICPQNIRLKDLSLLHK